MARTREQILELIRNYKLKTVDNGCTPGEAAKFAAKAAEWIEEYQISEAELRNADGATPAESEIVQNKLRTGKRVFNPGMTQVVNGLAVGMCCKVVLLHENHMAVYGIVGEQMDADYVCQMATTVVPALQAMAAMEGREHGYEKAGLIRWTNQYLTGAGIEIKRRLEDERKQRARQQEKAYLQRRLEQSGNREDVACLSEQVIDALLSALRDGTFDGIVAHGQEPPPSNRNTAIAIITGESLAIVKRERTEEAFREYYPKTTKTYSRSQFDGTAHERGREAGKRVGLHQNLKGE